MLKKVGNFIDGVFGQQDYERSLEGTDNDNIKKMLSVIAFFRFLLFPIAFCIYVVGFMLETILFILNLVSQGLFFTFELVNDSMWLKTSWFNLSADDITNEIEALAHKQLLEETEDGKR